MSDRVNYDPAVYPYWCAVHRMTHYRDGEHEARDWIAANMTAALYDPSEFDPDPLTVEPDPDPLPVAGHQGCARWWLLWLAVGAAFWIGVIAVILANRAAPRSESQPVPVEAPVPPSLEVAPATVGALSGAPHERDAGYPATSGKPSAPTRHDGGAPPLRGFATWCGPTPTQCQQWGGDAMLGAVPSFRFGDEPYMARVSRGERSVVVKVVSFCACGDRHGERTLIDLSPAAFAQLAPLSRGVVRVEVAPVSWKGME